MPLGGYRGGLLITIFVKILLHRFDPQWSSALDTLQDFKSLRPPQTSDPQS